MLSTIYGIIGEFIEEVNTLYDRPMTFYAHNLNKIQKRTSKKGRKKGISHLQKTSNIINNKSITRNCIVRVKT